VGQHGDAIKIRLKAAPVDGAANTELIAYVAKRLRVPKGDIRLAAGATSKRKRIVVEGWHAADIRRILLG
jgi:uncharacterized protein